jgi:hypothetical protein
MSDFKGPVRAAGKGIDYDGRWFEELKEAIELLIDDCHPNYEDVKQIKVFECTIETVTPGINADDIVEWIDDSSGHGDLPEEEYFSDNLGDADKKELEDFLEKWLPKLGREVYRDSGIEIEINWDEEITKYLAARAHYDVEPATT